MKEFLIRPLGDYSLFQSKQFLQGFVPASGAAMITDHHLDVAFGLDNTFAPTAVRLHQDADGSIHGEVFGTSDIETATKQTARMLGLDVDARGFDKLAKKDAVVRRVLAQYPGFRPVSFASPYEAAVWGVLAQRVSMRQAAAMRQHICAAVGDSVRIHGAEMHVFPAPKKVLATDSCGKIPEEKWARLRVVAAAAQRGILSAEHLLNLDPLEAMTQLGTLRGVGSWTAGHILTRGTGATDLIALHEPRVVAAIERLYERTFKQADLSKLAQGWSPYRTWVMVLFVLDLNRTGDWNVKGTRGKKPVQKASPLPKARSRARESDAPEVVSKKRPTVAAVPRPTAKSSKKRRPVAKRTKRQKAPSKLRR